MMPFGVHLLLLTLIVHGGAAHDAAELPPDVGSIAAMVGHYMMAQPADEDRPTAGVPAIGASDGDVGPAVEALFSGSGAGEEPPGLAVERAYDGWDRRDTWERRLLSLSAPEAAIHFDDILENARKQRLAEEEISLATQRVRASGARQSAAYGAAPDPFAWALAGVASLALAFALGLTLANLRRNRRARAELAAKESALVLLASAIKSAEAKPWAPELQAVLRQAMRENASSEYVRQLLRRHRELRLDPGRSGAASG